MRFLFALLLPALASAAIWPEQFAAFKLSSSSAAQASEPRLWDEYGFVEGQRVQYSADDRKFTATGYRFHDSTGAMAAFEALRPADAKPSGVARLAAEASKGLIVVHGNFLLVFNDYRPQAAELAGVIENLANVDSSPLPALMDYLPAENRIANSERYILGPVALAKFAPAIPPSTAAFRFGAEAQMGTFRDPGGEMRMAVFEYPTPQIAMERVLEFQKVPGSIAKRSGPLVAIVLSPPNADAAERLLSLVRYQPSITMSERVPTRKDNIGDLIINAFVLIGVLLAFSAVAGLALGGFRAVFRRGRRQDQPEPMILLHLEDRS